MSNISNSHNVQEYVVGVTKPLSNQRLAVVFYKTDKESGIKKDSKCVSIPVVSESHISETELMLFKPHLIELIKSTQNKIIRELIDGDNRTVIHDADITIGKVLEYLEDTSGDENGGGRLTKEVINTWFDSQVSDNLMLALSDKLGVGENPSNEQAQLVERTVQAFKSRICTLASGATKMDIKTANSVKNAINIGCTDENDTIKSKLIKRIDKMLEVKEVDLLDVL